MRVKKPDYLSVLVTFVMGLIAGAYLYTTEAAEFIVELTVPNKAEEVIEFTVESEAYGGCREVCPSFQVQYDGSYRYVYTPGIGQPQVLRQGSLPLPVLREVRNALSEKALARQSQPVEPVVCNSYTDGIDVKYEITFAEQEYTIDSCGTAVDGKGALWQSLNGIWSYFETVGNNS